MVLWQFIAYEKEAGYVTLQKKGWIGCRSMVNAMIKLSHNDKIKTEFSKQAKNFESGELMTNKQEYLTWAVSIMGLQPGETVLDVATGTGKLARAIASGVSNIIGLDMTEQRLAVGRQAAEEEQIGNLRFMQGDAENLPFEDNSFDRVVSRFAFHHFADVRKALAEMERVLRPGGKLVMIDLIAAQERLAREWSDRIDSLRDASHVKKYTMAEFIRLLAWKGLVVEKTSITDVIVDLESWIGLTNPSADRQLEICKLMKQEMDGENITTGFRPFMLGENIKFLQHWGFILAHKLREDTKEGEN